MSPVIYSTMQPDNDSWQVLSIVFSAHWKVDKSEDVKLYQYRETQEDGIKDENIDAQFLVKFPFIDVYSTHL